MGRASLNLVIPHRSGAGSHISQEFLKTPHLLHSILCPQAPSMIPPSARTGKHRLSSCVRHPPLLDIKGRAPIAPSRNALTHLMVTIELRFGRPTT